MGIRVSSESQQEERYVPRVGDVFMHVFSASEEYGPYMRIDNDDLEDDGFSAVDLERGDTCKWSHAPSSGKYRKVTGVLEAF